jgi:hypothetical protein
MQLNRNPVRQQMPKVRKAINPQVKRKRIKQATKKCNINNSKPSSFYGEEGDG